MTIIDDYIDYCDEYTKKYGEKTVVLIQVGSFHECYSVMNDAEQVGADIVTICDLLNIQLSRKNKSILENSRANPLMAGFPISSQAKHTQTLLSNNFTVVLINQVTPPPNPKREVTEILSPGLQLSPQGAEGSWLFVCYWDVHAKELSAGFCGIDVSTGQSWVYEVAGTLLSLDELSRCLSVYQPKEVVVVGSAAINKDEYNQDAITKIVGYVDNTHILWNAANSPGTKYNNVSYQNEVLKKAYSSAIAFGMLSPIEALDLERMDNVRTALVFAIQFSYEHNPNIIQYLQKPTHQSFDARCNLEHTSASQLQLVGSGSGDGKSSGERPLLSILCRCATAFGARAFKARLLQPTHDKTILQSRYDDIEACMNKTDFMTVYNSLRSVLDLERIARKIRLGTFNPTDWSGLDTSLKNISKAAATASIVQLTQVVVEIIDGYNKILDIDQCAKFLIGDIKGNVFLPGVYAEVDKDIALHSSAFDNINLVCEKLNTFGERCKIDFSDRDGYSLHITKKRWDTIKTALPDTLDFGHANIKTSGFSARPVSSSSSIVKLTHPFISEQSDLIMKMNAVIADRVTILYKLFLNNFADKYTTLLETCVKFTSDLDILVTCARNAIDFKYTKPMLAVKDTNRAYFDAIAMRHPILERLNDKVMYVPNDVSLGTDTSGNGLLLFGVNSSGKSSLMKAIGLNVIMAQAGMFVACDSFNYEPYRHVFTRIAGTDDIYRGWSTFTVEMMELRNILLRSDAYSLVLGDELCSGTESLSATAIVAAGIETLCKSKVSFVFATHLHDLSKMNRITKRKDVNMSHMHVEWQKDCLVYDRRMRPGVGSGVYGLEVCRGLNLPLDFLKVAHEVRCELSDISPFFIDPKTSRYNSGVFMDVCKICNTTSSQETHHIVPQASPNGHGHYSKDAAFNLLPVCAKCHDIIHSGKGQLTVSGYIATTSGRKLDKSLLKL